MRLLPFPWTHPASERQARARCRYRSHVTILVVLGGLLAVAAAIVALFNRPEGVGLWAVIVTGVLGLVYLLVAKGLWNGNGFSRLIVAVITFLNLIAGVWALYLRAARERHRPGSRCAPGARNPLLLEGAGLLVLTRARDRALAGSSAHQTVMTTLPRACPVAR